MSAVCVHRNALGTDTDACELCGACSPVGLDGDLCPRCAHEQAESGESAEGSVPVEVALAPLLAAKTRQIANLHLRHPDPATAELARRYLTQDREARSPKARPARRVSAHDLTMSLCLAGA